MNAQHRMPFARIDLPADEAPRSAARRVPVSRLLLRFLGGFLVVLICAAVAWPLLPRRFESTASVILRPTDDQGRLDSLQSLRQPLDDNAIQSEMDIIGSPVIASAVIAHHHLENDPEFAGDPDRLSARALSALYRFLPSASAWLGDIQPVSEVALRDRLQKHLIVSRDRRSYTVKMGYWSSDPAKAAALTNTLLNAYLEDQLARKRGSAEQQSALLLERVEGLRGRYDNSERTVREYALQSDLDDSAMLTSLEAQRSALTAEAADLRARIALRAAAGDVPGPSGARPAIPPSQTVPATIQPSLPAGSDTRSLDAREAVVQKALRTVREAIADRRLAALKLEALRREAAIDKELLDGAMVRLKEQAPRLSTVGPGVEILARPDPALRPTFPNAFLFVVGTLVAALAAGVAMAWNPRAADLRRALSGR